MSRSNKTWSPIKENLLMQHLAKLERSPSSEDSKTFGSQCSINLDNKYLDLPTEPKRRRLMADDTPSSISSQLSSQVSSRSHSPSLSMSESSLFDDSAMSTPCASPSATLKDHFRKKYRKDELWAAIETNYKYLMDKGIIEACQTTESEGEETTLNSNVSFGVFLEQYKELSDWLKNIQVATQRKKASKLALAEKYLNQSYHDEIQRSPRLKAFNDYAYQLTQRQPILCDEINVFLKEVNTQWDAVEAATAPTYQDADSMLRDLQDDLECLRKYLDSIEDDLRGQTMRAWAYEELEDVLREHKACIVVLANSVDPDETAHHEPSHQGLHFLQALQQDIESHSRVVSAILKLSERLQKDNDAFDSDSLEREHQRDSVELSALNLERRWHGIWLQSLEWQCRLEDAISRKAGVYNPGPFLDPSLRDYTESDTEYDLHDVTSSGDDSFQGLGYRADFIQSPPKSDSSASFSPDCDTRSCGKDSAIVSEAEVRTSSDMSEAYQDLSVSSTGSDSDREYLRMMKMRKRDSRDIGYGSESASDELDSRYRQGITFSGINGRARNVPKSGSFYTTVIVDKIDTESTDKTDVGNNAELTTCDESDLGSQLQAVLAQEESEKEDIRYLIDQADIMVQQGNTFNKSLSGQGHSIGIGMSSESTLMEDGSPKSSSSSGVAPEMVDKGVGTIESSCDASDEESGDSDGPGEEVSMVTDDGADMFDSVVCSEYTSDEMRYASKDFTRLPKLYDTNSLKRRVKGRGKERPWSVIELADVMETKPLSTSESAIDKLAGTYSDSDIPSKSSTLSQSTSPTLSRHRIRRTQCMTRSKSESYSLRSQVGAKRKLDLELPLSSVPPIEVTAKSEATNFDEFVNVNSADNVAEIKSVTVNKYNVVSNDLASPETTTSGNTTIVPSADLLFTSDEDTSSGMPTGNDLIYALQNARFRSSGSSYEESDTQGDPGGVVSEPDDQNNGNASSYSESAWDNYQAPLYPSCGEGAQEEALHWEPGDLEFEDEFSLPQSTIIATLIARRSEDETYSGRRPKLVPSNQGNYDDSDSDIEDLHHVLDESRMQLKVADKSLRKKRKDPLATGLYLNPGKYGELLATIDTNIKCLETICQHLQPTDVMPEDIQTIRELLYQWEKLQALASERRNQSQELKTMYATLLSVQGTMLVGVPQIERTRFRSMEDLVATIAHIQGTQKLLHNQQQMVKNLHVAIDMFSSHNPSVNVEGVIKQLQDTDGKLDCLQNDCVRRLGELEHIAEVWCEYKGERLELEWLLKEERELLERLAFSQEVDMAVYKVNMEGDLKKLVSSLSVYEEKLIKLEHLRAELTEVADDDVQLDLTAGIADIRNQLYVAQQQCRDIVFTDDLARSTQGYVEDMEVEEEVMKTVEAVPPKKLEEPKSTLVRKRRASAKPKRSLVPAWLKSFPVQAIALAVFLGLIYFAAPESLRKLINFTLRLSPDLKYVNGAPPL